MATSSDQDQHENPSLEEDQDAIMEEDRDAILEEDHNTSDGAIPKPIESHRSDHD